MKITLDIPDSLAASHTFSQVNWLQEVAVALFRQERVTLGTASQLAGMNQMAFHELLYDRSIDLHYDLADYQARHCQPARQQLAMRDFVKGVRCL